MSTTRTGRQRAVPDLSDGAVTLRGLRAADLPAVVEYASEAQMRRWTSVPQPYTSRDAENFLASAAHGWSEGTGYHFAVQAEQRFAGIIDLRLQGAGLGEIGFGLMAWARGRGFITSALRQLIPWAFEDAELAVLHWRAQVGNWPSRRAAWAVGFAVEGRVAGLLEHRGERVDGWIGALRPGDRLHPAYPWLEPVRIAGPGLVLRAHHDGDLARMSQAGADPLAQKWLANLPAPYTEADARAHLDQILTEQAEGKAVYWVVADRSGEQLLAEIGLFIRDLRAGQVEIGYWTHPDSRGRGVATAAVRLAVRHALLPVEDGGLGMRRVLLRAAAGNLASQAVATRAGFTRTGVDRGADLLRDGTAGDDVRFDLLAAELPAASSEADRR